MSDTNFSSKTSGTENKYRTRTPKLSSEESLDAYIQYVFMRPIGQADLVHPNVPNVYRRELYWNSQKKIMKRNN